MPTRRLPGFAIFLFLLAFFLSQLEPFSILHLSRGLDPSWMATAVYSLEHGFRFGRDLIFTVGPYSPIYTRLFAGEWTYLTVTLSVSAIIFLAWALTALLQLPTTNRSKSETLVILLSLFVVGAAAFAEPNAFLFVLPFTTALAFTYLPARLDLLFSGIFLSAVMAMAKFSAFPFSVGAFLVLDILAITQRRLPYKTGLFLLCCFVLYVAAGQLAGDFFHFITTQLQISAGFSEAMAVWGSLWELFGWLSLALCLSAIFFLSQVHVARNGGTDWFSAFARCLLLAGLVFVSFKAGFVRHDDHSLIAWSALSLAAFILTLVKGPGRLTYLPWFVLCLFVVTTAISAWAFHKKGHGWSTISPTAKSERLRQQFWQAVRFSLNPEAWLASRQLNHEREKATLAKALLDPQLNGTVDTIPSIQADLIALDVQFKPRPVFQEYATYSKGLIDANRAFFENPSRPQYVLFAPGSIDDRHPALAEGPLWPTFLKLYEPVSQYGPMLVLQQRRTPLDTILTAPIAEQTKFGVLFKPPAQTQALYLRLQIAPTFLGRILTFAFRPPTLFLEVTYADNKVEKHRIIPAISDKGFIAVPTIDSALDYGLLAAGRAASPRLRRPTAFRVTGTRFASHAYRLSIRLEWSAIDSRSLVSTRNAFLDKLVEREEGIAHLLAVNAMRPPMLALDEDGVFAHAPSEMFLPVHGAHSLAIGFGMKDGAWQRGKTDGVCFEVHGPASKLFEQCLDPSLQVSDRGEQRTQITIPAETSRLSLRTVCRSSCDWDWAYWSRALPVEANKKQ